MFTTNFTNITKTRITNTELETMSAVYGLPIYQSKPIRRYKTCVAKILTVVTDKSIIEERKLEQKHIRTCKEPEVKVRQSVDGAYPNKAGNKSKYCYMYVVNQSIHRCTDYDVLCILKQGHNVDSDKYGSKQLEHKLAEILLPKSIDRLERAATKCNKKILSEIVGDRDIKWTEIVEAVDAQTTKVTIKRLTMLITHQVNMIVLQKPRMRYLKKIVE